jgi:hypothetical protein
MSGVYVLSDSATKKQFDEIVKDDTRCTEFFHDGFDGLVGKRFIESNGRLYCMYPFGVLIDAGLMVEEVVDVI